MKYIKEFETHSQYESYISGGNVAKPNVSYCDQENECHYNVERDEVTLEIEVTDITYGMNETFRFTVSHVDATGQIEVRVGDETHGYVNLDNSARAIYSFKPSFV